MELDDVAVVHPRQRAAVVELHGEHDTAQRDRLHRLLLGLVRANDLVVLDVSEAVFIDSTVIATILEANAAAARQGTTFRLQTGTAAIVRRMIEVSGVLQLVAHAGSREDALA